MSTLMITLAALAAQVPAAQAELSGQARASLRCAAAFALVSYGQETGDPAAAQWPTIDPRGREYFVRSIARIMDEAKIDRDRAAQLVELEAKRLLDANEVDSVMPACLLLLDASGI